MVNPKEITQEEINEVLTDFFDHFAKVRAHKGMFPFVDEYQAFAKIRAELNEFDDAIEKCQSTKSKTKELFDLITGALWTVVSYRAGMKQKVKKKGKRTVGLKMSRKQRALYEKLRKESMERLRPHIEAAQRSTQITAADLATRVG